jgi:hypothetical protein
MTIYRPEGYDEMENFISSLPNHIKKTFSKLSIQQQAEKLKKDYHNHLDLWSVKELVEFLYQLKESLFEVDVQ